jgi:opacity protein-like surface antigen
MKIIYSVILSILLMSASLNAQSFKVGAGIGYSVPAGDYGGETTGFYNGTEYGMSSGFNVHAKARLGFVFMSIFGEVGYSSFSGEGNAEENRGTLNISNSIISIKAGPEFQLSIPTSPITPYLQGFAAFNSFTGSVDIKGVSSVPSGEYDIQSASRIGLGLGAGVLFDVAGLNLDLNIQYHLMNVAGKEFTSVISTSHDRLESYTALNDEKDPIFNVNSDHFIGDSRSINAIEIKLSVLFGL